MINFISSRRIDASKLVLAAVFISFVLIPFLRMVFNITMEDVIGLMSSSTFVPALKNSLLSASIGTFISVTIGLLLALCIQRTNISFKEILSVLLLIPILIPSLSHGMGLIVLFGTNGVITNLLGLDCTIYGFNGVILGAILYSYPVAFLMLNDVLKYEDSSPYEAAKVLGIPKLAQIRDITIPYLKRPLISAVFAVFTLIITDYGVPMMIGGKTVTLAVLMYQEVLGQLDFGKGSVVGLFLLVPALITFTFNVLLKGKAKATYITKQFRTKSDFFVDGISYIFCGFVVLSIFALIASFLLYAFSAKYPHDLTFTFANVLKMFKLNGGRYLINSVVIAIVVSLIGIAMAFSTAYLTTRLPSKMSNVLHLFSITSLAIPGMVLGLSYSMTFGGTYIYGTILILILANIVHFFASPYLMIYNSLSKMNENLESVGKTLGIRRLRIITAVIIPQCKSTIFEMFSYFFVNSIMTISAVSFLANASTKPVSLLINQFEAQMQMECAAVVSLIILVVNMFVKFTVYFVNRYNLKKA